MADYDGDGRMDIISGSSCCQGACFYVFLRQEDGGFAERRRVDLRFPGMARDQTALTFGFKGLASKVAVADWNGDGAVDVVIGGSSDTRRFVVAYGPLAGKEELTIHPLWPQQEPPRPGAFPTPPADGEAPLRWITTNPCVADWDGDGRPDLILGGYRGYSKEKRRYTDAGVYWLRNVGEKQKPELAEPQRLVAMEDDYLNELRGLAVADWNADGLPDLLVSRFDYQRTESRRKSLQHNHVWVYLRRDR